MGMGHLNRDFCVMNPGSKIIQGTRDLATKQHVNAMPRTLRAIMRAVLTRICSSVGLLHTYCKLTIFCVRTKGVSASVNAVRSKTATVLTGS